MPPKRLEKLTKAVADVTGKRYCSSHRGESLSDTGMYIVRGNVRRWICFLCLNRIQNAKQISTADHEAQPQRQC